jgi:GTPase
MFTDRAEIYLKAGNGGNGIVSFRREKYVAAGGPDGGDGGKGGDIVLEVDRGKRTLRDFKLKRYYRAESGRNGGPSNRTGKNGRDMGIKVPAGTLIIERDTGTIIADMTEYGEKKVIVRGGRGGKGNKHYATSTRQVPGFSKTGEEGEELWIRLELKLLADVGLIGYPNTGKSTILSVVSSAKPEIADYHFTTIEPNLGVVYLEGDRSFVIADIPGIIEGAHQGAGLGHEFLRHIERTKLLVHVVDISGIEGRDPVEDFELINSELKNYNEKLAKKPQIIAANKIDLLLNSDFLIKFKKKMEEKGYSVFPISALNKKGLNELMNHVAKRIENIPNTILAETVDDEKIYTAKQEEPFNIVKEGSTFIVSGKWVRKVMGSVNTNDNESLQYLQKVMKKKGVIKTLEEMGMKEGDTVRIENIEFEYIK